MKKIYTIGIAFLFVSYSINAQIPGYFEIRVTDLPGSATNRAILQMKPVNASLVPAISECDVDDQLAADIVGGFTFGVKWPVSSGITNVTVTNSGNTQPLCPDINDPTAGYGVSIPGGNGSAIPTNDGTTLVKGGLILNTPTAVPVAWTLNQWITICTLTITGGTCTVCDALAIYEPGNFPEVENQVTVDNIWAYDQTGSGIALEYLITPVNAPLPLNLITFEARKYETQDAFLTWTTANEENTSHFQIQRSFDKKNWYDAGSVSAAGYSIDIRNYTFMDYKVYNGRDARLPVYYRLNMVDLDGRSKLSPIQSVIFGNNSVASNSFSVYPNPSTDGIQVEWDANNIDQPTLLEIYDITGKLVLQQKVSENANQEYIDFGPAKITSGLYLLRILNGTEPIDHKQIVVGQSR